MPAPCPGDPDYPRDEIPLTRANFEAEIEKIRERRAPILAELARARTAPLDAWERALRDELHGDDDQHDEGDGDGD